MNVQPDPLAPLAAQLFRPLGAQGVYARSALYEGVVERLGAFITGWRHPDAEVLRFPPVMSRAQLERSGYLKSFPNLLGCICALHGREREIREAVEANEPAGQWTRGLAPTELVLSPAACYPLYPLVAARGRLPAAGLEFDVAADCFRREPSPHLDRLQSFRMREYVRLGSAASVLEFRAQWLQRVPELATALGLPFSIDVASDPFFGRAGRMMAESQRQQSLKFELLVPWHEGATPTACMSFNYHREHFGQAWGIEDGDGAPAHTSCIAFGIDRLALAMFCIHGPAPERWPPEVRHALGP